MTAMKMMRKIPRNDAARKPVMNPVGFEVTAVGLETRLERDPPITSTPTIPATIAQMMLQRRTTNPLPNAKPQPTMKRSLCSRGYLREQTPSTTMLGLNSDDYVSCFLSCVDVSVSFGSLFQRVAS